jgi:putative chitinase
MRVVEILKEFGFPDVGGKIYDLTHPAPATATSTKPIPKAGPQLGPTPIAPAPSATVAPKLNTNAKPEPAAFNPSQHKETLIKIAKQRGITAINDLSNLLGQSQVETGNWSSAVENFMYADPTRIYKVFTSKFTSPQEAIPYVKNPVALANRALAGKNGNGDEASGDGWSFRGRGFLHITGRELYAKAGAGVHPENPSIYINNPTLLSSDPKEAAKAAVWYHKTKIGKGKTSKQASAIVNPAGMKSKERGQASQQIKQQLTQKTKKPR